jgi:polyferredoxin
MNLVFESVADLLMLAHAGLSLFLIVGLVLIITGMIFGWRWIRDARFRGVHLAAALFVATRAWMGIPCPFSVAEDALRLHVAGDCFLGGGFHLSLHELAFRENDPAQFRNSATGLPSWRQRLCSNSLFRLGGTGQRKSQVRDCTKARLPYRIHRRLKSI